MNIKEARDRFEELLYKDSTQRGLTEDEAKELDWLRYCYRGF